MNFGNVGLVYATAKTVCLIRADLWLNNFNES